MQWGTVHDFSPQSLAQPISTLSLSGSRITVRWSFKNLHSSGLSFFRPLAVPSASDMLSSNQWVFTCSLGTDFSWALLTPIIATN